MTRMMNRSTRNPFQAVIPTPVVCSSIGASIEGVVSMPNGMPRVNIRPGVLTPVVGHVGHHTR